MNLRWYFFRFFFPHVYRIIIYVYNNIILFCIQTTFILFFGIEIINYIVIKYVYNIVTAAYIIWACTEFYRDYCRF